MEIKPFQWYPKEVVTSAASYYPTLLDDGEKTFRGFYYNHKFYTMNGRDITDRVIQWQICDRGEVVHLN